MRAPPPPRVSKSNFWILAATYIKNIFNCHRLKKRWNLHQLKKKTKQAPYNISQDISPISGIRVEDMMNIPTHLLPSSSKSKPLLIATFPRGCSRSPHLKLLEKNSFTTRTITRKKYKTEYLNNSRVKYTSNKVKILSKHDPSLKCIKTVRSIKGTTKKYADIKLIFHDKNVIKVSNIKNTNTVTPTVLEFDGANVIVLKNYKNLRNSTVKNQVSGN
ncbi:similar to Saccharomyces cerevisiae YOR255W OSW1 Protein involved in sporulation [Maudiozyma saulgeensis]|uniref:Similar to Saccharomyces cerevisiae YOR255W OSW1 Protein involved in sporulation n=1 Tax=Maudiozyma saulgeensis TaxID=1789683 RepID=A0A1X7R9H4_9SACH|nr:similar to Saccharomyces cerevisiae YOR255W OSW1 Protein involved in sporulation [Kazachstania saulgeensis]